MSRYDLGWRKQLEFRLATRSARNELLRNIALVVALVLLYGVVGAIDYQIEQRELAERALEFEGARAQVLRDCERGAVGYYYADGRAFECGKPI